MKISEFIKKLQNQPEKIKKIVLWSIIVVIGLGLFTFWVIMAQQKIKGFKKQDFIKGFNLPNFDEQIKEVFPSGLPEFNEEELKKLEGEEKTNQIEN